jgi:pimeloyl-ACP methyl ester carboxylesterase
MMEQPPEAVAAALRAMAARPDRGAALAGLRGPAVIVAGEEDPLIPREESEAMARLVPGGAGSFHLVEGTAHLSNLEQPGLFNSILTSLVRRVAGN